MRKLLLLSLVTVMSLFSTLSVAGDLGKVREQGVLRHLGVPYANFVTGQGDGMSVELIQLFAASLGVDYEYVATDWSSAISDLVGRQITQIAGKAQVGDPVPVRGDLIANGLTVLPWRAQVLDYSLPTFPTQVWLVTRASSPLQPIRPLSETEDIAATRALLSRQQLLGKQNTCLDPALYPFADDNFESVYFSGNLNDMFPAVMQGDADMTLLDVPDTLVALTRWPGQVKVLGPLSEKQNMAVGFRQDSPKLREAFNRFYREIRQNGEYTRLVQKYYPDVFDYYPAFFQSPI